MEKTTEIGRGWAHLERIEDDWYDGPILRVDAVRAPDGEVRVDVAIGAHLSENGWAEISFNRADLVKYIEAIDRHATSEASHG